MFILGKQMMTTSQPKTNASSIRVVNDTAERGVALMEEYNKLHTNNEEQKQYMLLAVKEFHQRYPHRH